MKKIILLIIAGGFLTIQLNAQVASYIFSVDTAIYTEITGGVSLGDTTTDDKSFVDPAVLLGSTSSSGVGLPIEFNFIFNGEISDVFGINSNGWIAFGKSSLTPSVNIGVFNTYKPISAVSSISPAFLQNKISVFGCDIEAKWGGSLRYETIGSAPDRILVVQWKGYKKYGYNTCYGDNFNFQIRLYETTNIVEFVYGAIITPDVVFKKSPQVGLRGSSGTDFLNRTSTTSWSSSSAGTQNTDTMVVSNTVFPPSGLVYKFTPLLVNINNTNFEKAEINIFPNPSNGIANISINDINNAELTIYTIDGQKVYSEKISGTDDNIQLNLSYLSKGIYMLKISGEKNNILKKLIIK